LVEQDVISLCLIDIAREQTRLGLRLGIDLPDVDPRIDAAGHEHIP
jgi:hypothetical protein